MPSFSAASWVARHSDCSPGWLAFDRTASLRRFGKTSLSSSTLLPASSSDRKVEPVKLPPGWPRLWTRPSSTGSPLSANRTGTSATAVIARVAGPLDTARSTLPRLSSDRHFAQRLRIPDRIVQFEDDVLALDVAPRAQSLPEPFQEGIGLGLGGEPENAINSRRILRESGGRTGHRSANKCNEISPVHAAQYGSDQLSRLEARIQIISRYP